jgi:hypothetical protein
VLLFSPLKLRDKRVSVTGMKYPIKNCLPSNQGKAEAFLTLKPVINEMMNRTGRYPISR